MKYISHNIKETRALAKEMVRNLKFGGTIGLIGELGAGKTAFTQGLAKALGVKAAVNSPTFVLMKIYPTKHKVIKALVHVDAYRLDELANLEELGLIEYLNDPSVLVVVEWAGKIKGILPKKTKYYYFKTVSEAEREISWL